MVTTRRSLIAIAVMGVLLFLSAYFALIAVQGDYGLLRRVELLAEADRLTAERDRLRADLAELQNRTHRLSDSYLDLDLLDERVREVLGYVRADEVVLP
ncbi:MAG: septum formation initiator family protein [Rhodobacteraceae bacterium]|nr:septum formation initiator family protein [Paracoccaceae bacterium]